MPRDLFGSGATSTPLTRAFNRYTVIGSAALHLVIIAVVLIVPLLADDVLPTPDPGRVQFVNNAFVPPEPPAPMPKVVRVNTPNRDLPPILAPDRIRDPEPPQSANVAEGGFDLGPTSTATGVGPNLGDNLGPPIAAPPVAAPPPRPVRQGPVPVGGLIHAPVKVQYVAPVYPAIAQAARVEGTVVIEAVIGIDGAVQQARVVSGSPLLNDAALTAVRQWRYTPTTLNNQPVAVIMTVTVSFTLQH